MAAYWSTFRIHEDAGYSERYDRLMHAFREVITGTHWDEPTSFLMFESKHDIDMIAQHLKKSIAPAKDLVLVGMVEVKSARLVGAYKDKDIFVLMPFTKYV